MPSSEARVVARQVHRTYARIAKVVRSIPRGKVATYGQVARLAGMPRGARVVGYAMHALRDAVPWQRVLGVAGQGRGRISIKDPIGGAAQRAILEAEGVRFDARGRVDLARHGFSAVRPKTPRPARAVPGRPRKTTRRS
jgi:methylated-DNA-protein-cysteine methyltransferase-like protein